MKNLDSIQPLKNRFPKQMKFIFILGIMLISGHFMSTMAYPGCDDPSAANYDPNATSNDGTCEYPITSCGPDTYSYCYTNNEFIRFYYQADSGSDLYVLLNGGEVQGGADFFFIWDNFEGVGSPMYTVSGPLHAGTILHSTTGELMVQIVSGPSVNCVDQGYDPVSYTVRCDAPVPNGICSNAAGLTPEVYPGVNNTLANLWFVENSGDPVCAGNTGADLFYEFAVAEENTFTVNVNPIGGSDLVVQVLDACGGNELGCVNVNGAGGAESVLLENLTPGNYTVRIHNESGDVETESSGMFLINVQQFPLARVQDNPANVLYGCNTTDRQLEDFVGASPQTSQQPGILDYEWLVAEQGGTGQFTWQRGEANYSTRLDWLNMEYGKTYNVFVRVLIDHPEFGAKWGVFRGDYQNPNAPGASTCTITTSANITPTELLPAYQGTNVDGNPYRLCDFAIAFNVLSSEDFRWRFDVDMDPNNGNEIYYTRGSGNPSVRLSWVDGLLPGVPYNVAVEVRVDGQWSGYGNVHQVVLSGVPNVAVRPNYCGNTFAPNGYLLSESVCEADFYRFRFTPQFAGSTRQKTTLSYPLNMGTINPPLEPGIYNVQVQVQQNGVLGDYSPSIVGDACEITISGPTMPGDAPIAQRSETTGNATLFPNPNTGNEVRLELDGLTDRNHEVMIQIYDVYGKLIQTDGFGHQGDRLSRLVRFENDLAMGMYMVHVVVDGDQFATERLIVK